MTKKIKYKKFTNDKTFASAINFEIPETWSSYMGGDKMGTDDLLEEPTYSVGQYNVAFGDINWMQVDFYIAQHDIVDKLVADRKAVTKEQGLSDSVWTTEIVAGIPAVVYNDPLDPSGEVSKGGSGGKTYFIYMPEQGQFSARTLVIVEQSAANEEFTNGFDHLMKTLQFTQS